MKWIDIGIEIGLICLICAAWLKNRCKTKEQGILRFLMPIGNTIAGILQPTRRKRERNSMFQLLCQLTTEEEGERLYQSYRCKRWAILIGILVFCNGVWIIQQAITAAPKS